MDYAACLEWHLLSFSSVAPFICIALEMSFESASKRACVPELLMEKVACKEAYPCIVLDQSLFLLVSKTLDMMFEESVAKKCAFLPEMQTAKVAYKAPHPWAAPEHPWIQLFSRKLNYLRLYQALSVW
jgi:hypothetical protein